MSRWLKDSWLCPLSFKPFSLSWSKDHTTVHCRRLDSIALGLQITQRGGRHLPLAILRSSPIPGSTQIQSASYPALRSAKQFYLPPIQVETHSYSVSYSDRQWSPSAGAFLIYFVQMGHIYKNGIQKYYWNFMSTCILLVICCSCILSIYVIIRHCKIIINDRAAFSHCTWLVNLIPF